MMRFKIVVRTHGYHVTALFASDLSLMDGFKHTLSSYEARFNHRTKRTTRTLKCTYATYHKHTQTYGFHKNTFDDFISYLKKQGVDNGDIELTIVDSYMSEYGQLALAEGVEPYDYQIPIIDYIINSGFTSILPLQTGKGKTACSLFCIHQLRLRTAIIMSAGHVNTWLKDAKWMFTNADKEIIVIQGSESLKAVIANAQSGTLNASVLIFTVNTIRDYLTDYEDNGTSSYGCVPSELYETLKVGFRITDEAHENLHFGFRHDIETNVNKALYLSATIKSNDSFINKLYKIIFPINKQYVGLEWDRYIVAKAVGYRLHQPHQARYNGAMGYSHTLYEQWLMKTKTRSNAYYQMVCDIVRNQFIQTYKPKQKALIYVSTIDMSFELADYLKKHLMTTLSIVAYNGTHDNDVLHNNDIVVSTPKKSGTGKDIKGLVLVVSTVSVHGREINTQMLGRLRKLGDLYPGVEPTFIYLFCVNIPKQVHYHQSKLTLFTPITKSIKSYNSSYVI